MPISDNTIIINDTTIWQTVANYNEAELIALLTNMKQLYYQGNPAINDNNYDALLEKLRLLNPNSTFFSNIGYDISSAIGEKVKLHVPMYSMDKLKIVNGVIKIPDTFTNTPICITDKLDGISVQLSKHNNQLMLTTRGDATTGINITRLISKLNLNSDALNRIQNGFTGRAELVIPRSTFISKYAKIRMNSRNMIAGLLNSKTIPTNIDLKDIDVVFYELIDVNSYNSDQSQLKQQDQLEILSSLGFITVHHSIVDNLTSQVLIDQLANRNPNSPYDIDGIIATINSPQVKNKQDNPSYAFAYKGLTGISEVQVSHVKWKGSYTAKLVPVIHFQVPVMLSGALISKTTGFNAAFIVANKIGPTSIIIITRSGDTIPHVIGIKTQTGPSLPSDRPHAWNETQVNIYDTDPDTNPDIAIARLTKFFKDLKVSLIAKGTVKKLYSSGFTTLPLILDITIPQLLTIPTIKQKMATKIKSKLDELRSKPIPLSKIMIASSMFPSFSTKIDAILQAYPTIIQDYTSARRNSDVVDVMTESEYDDWIGKLIAIDKIQKKTAGVFLSYVPKFNQWLSMIGDRLVIEYPQSISNNSSSSSSSSHPSQVLVGCHVAFSGFRDDTLVTRLKALGGSYETSLNKKVNLLVLGNPKKLSAKITKAKDAGLDTMTRVEFEAFITAKEAL